MSTRTRWWTAALMVPFVAAACGSPSDREGRAAARPTPTTLSSPTSPTAGAETMPDLTGLGSAVAGRVIGGLGLGSDWRTVTVRCMARPGTVVRQSPAPGAALGADASVRIGVAALDVAEFRGPCDVADGDLGPVAGPDASLARQFYRFAADPSLGAPFAGEVWTGIEDGLASTTLDAHERADPAAWRLRTEYAEGAGPFSALDVVASSGGYYEVRRGVVGTCPAGDEDPPAELKGLRAITLTPARDTVGSCIDWWGVTLFLEGEEIRGVALRLGSP